ncbi:MAG TPA: MFS transporter, partial [Blastocatellia bacterium]|jgi:MFS family permease|nr:MFS transporter [Blastocatellia bacterium]
MVETEHQTKKEARVGAYAWAVVALLWVVALLNYLDRQIIFSVFPLLKADLRLSDAELGLLGSAFLWVYALLSPISGFLADRFGRVRIIIVSLLVWSMVTWLTRYARSFDELIATRALMGLSEACYIPAALALIADYHSKGRLSLASGIHTSGIYVGIILGGAGGGWMGERFGWRFAFAALGAFGVVYTLILLLTLRGTKTAKREEAAKPQFLPALRELLSLPGFKTLLLVFASFSLANWAIYTWLPNYLYERFNMKLAAAGFSATFYIQVASFGGILLGGWMADRWNQVSARGRVLTQCIGVALAAPCLFLVGFTSSTAPLIAGLIVFGLGRGFYDCNTMPVLSQIARSDLRATGYGILNMAGTLTGGVIAAVAGALKTRIGLGGVFQIAALLLLISAVTLSRLRVERDV